MGRFRHNTPDALMGAAGSSFRDDDDWEDTGLLLCGSSGDGAAGGSGGSVGGSGDGAAGGAAGGSSSCSGSKARDSGIVFDFTDEIDEVIGAASAATGKKPSKRGPSPPPSTSLFGPKRDRSDSDSETSDAKPVRKRVTPSGASKRTSKVKEEDTSVGGKLPASGRGRCTTSASGGKVAKGKENEERFTCFAWVHSGAGVILMKQFEALDPKEYIFTQVCFWKRLNLRCNSDVWKMSRTLLEAT